MNESVQQRIIGGEEFRAKLHRDISKETSYLIGVSGGRDSVALLHLLHQEGFEKLIVCHVNHLLRDSESHLDEAFVKRQAEEFGYSFYSIQEDIQSVATQKKQSIETAARDVRHQFFARTAAERDCPPLAVGTSCR